VLTRRARPDPRLPARWIRSSGSGARSSRVQLQWQRSSCPRSAHQS